MDSTTNDSDWTWWHERIEGITRRLETLRNATAARCARIQAELERDDEYPPDVAQQHRRRLTATGWLAAEQGQAVLVTPEAKDEALGKDTDQTDKTDQQEPEKEVQPQEGPNARPGERPEDTTKEESENQESENSVSTFSGTATGCPIGTTVSGETLVLPESVRPQGLLILGQTGTGKTTLLEHLIRQDIATRTACVVLDPQGPMVRRLLSGVTPEQAEQVYVLEADLEHPFGINFYQIEREGKGRQRNAQELVFDKYVSLLISLFRKVFGVDRWINIEFALRHIARTLLANPGTTMADVPRLLTDEAFRRRCLGQVHNERTREFWRMWEESLSRNQQLRLSLITKFDEFLDAEFVSKVVSQPQTTIPFRELFAEGATVLISLPKGEHEGQTKILGALLLTEIARVIYERAKEPQPGRVHLYIDEYPRFGAEFTRELLTGGRQFGCGTTVAFQHLSQLEDGEDQDAVLQMGTKAIFRVIDTDGRTLARNLNRVVPVATRTQESTSQLLADSTYLLEERRGGKVTEKTRTYVQTKSETMLKAEQTREHYTDGPPLPDEVVFITEEYLRPLAERAKEYDRQGRRWLLDNGPHEALVGIDELLKYAQRGVLQRPPCRYCPEGIASERERLLCAEILPGLYLDELPEGHVQLVTDLLQSRRWHTDTGEADAPLPESPLVGEFWRDETVKPGGHPFVERMRITNDPAHRFIDLRERHAPIVPFVLPWIRHFDQVDEKSRRLNLNRLEAQLPDNWFGRQVWLWLRLAEVMGEREELTHTTRFVDYIESEPLERVELANLLTTLPPHHAVVHAPGLAHSIETAILPPPSGNRQATSHLTPEQQALIAGIRAKSRARLCSERQPTSPMPQPTKSRIRRSRPVEETKVDETG